MVWGRIADGAGAGSGEGGRGGARGLPAGVRGVLVLRIVLVRAGFVGLVGYGSRVVVRGLRGFVGRCLLALLCWFGVLFPPAEEGEEPASSPARRGRLVDGGRGWVRICIHLHGGCGLFLLEEVCYVVEVMTRGSMGGCKFMFVFVFAITMFVGE